MTLAPKLRGYYPDRLDTWATGGIVARETPKARRLHVRAHPADPPAQVTAAGLALLDRSVESWRVRIAERLGDGRVRSFHRLMLDLSDGQLSASRAFDSSADRALWSLVELRLVEHTIEDPVLFRLAKAGVLFGLSQHD